jgi:hypothetical protein
MKLDQGEVKALWTLAHAFESFAVAIPYDKHWLYLRIDNAHIIGKEKRKR